MDQAQKVNINGKLSRMRTEAAELSNRLDGVLISLEGPTPTTDELKNENENPSVENLVNGIDRSLANIRGAVERLEEHLC